MHILLIHILLRQWSKILSSSQETMNHHICITTNRRCEMGVYWSSQTYVVPNVSVPHTVVHEILFRLFSGREINSLSHASCCQNANELVEVRILGVHCLF